MEMPPESKVTPLPTRTIGRSAGAPCAQHDKPNFIGALTYRQKRPIFFRDFVEDAATEAVAARQLLSFGQYAGRHNWRCSLKRTHQLAFGDNMTPFDRLHPAEAFGIVRHKRNFAQHVFVFFIVTGFEIKQFETAQHIAFDNGLIEFVTIKIIEIESRFTRRCQGTET
jgi:hypothetical protein